MTNVESMDYTHSHPSTIASLSSTAQLSPVSERLAMVEGRKVRIIHGLNISHKELTYLLQK